MTRNIFTALIATAALSLGALGVSATAHAADPGEKAYTFKQLSPASTVVETTVEVASVDSDDHTVARRLDSKPAFEIADRVGAQIATLPRAKGGGR
jgi:hypothetical protein